MERESRSSSESDIFSRINHSPEGEIKNCRSFHLTKSIIIQESNSFQSIIINRDNHPNIKKINISAVERPIKNEDFLNKQQEMQSKMKKRGTTVANNNFYVPSLQHPSNENCFHPQSEVRLQKSQQYQFWYNTAIVLFIIFIICAVMPGKQLLQILRKVYLLMDGMLRIVGRIIQFMWQNLL